MKKEKELHYRFISCRKKISSFCYMLDQGVLPDFKPFEPLLIQLAEDVKLFTKNDPKNKFYKEFQEILKNLEDILSRLRLHSGSIKTSSSPDLRVLH